MTRSAIRPPTCWNIAANESTAAQTAASALLPAVICFAAALRRPRSETSPTCATSTSAATPLADSARTERRPATTSPASA